MIKRFIGICSVLIASALIASHASVMIVGTWAEAALNEELQRLGLRS